jgi:hypothetical protein
MKKCSLLQLSALALFCWAPFGAAWADSAMSDAAIASVAQVEGSVLVNQGREYVLVHPGIQLRAGHRIMTLEKAGVSVVYKDGCVQRLNENAVMTLKSAGECSAKTAQVRSVGPHYAEAIGAGPIGTDAGPIGKEEEEKDNRKMLLWLAGGGALATGGYLQYRNTHTSRNDQAASAQ